MTRRAMILHGLVGPFLILLGLGVAVYGYRFAQNQRRIEAEGEPADAFVTDAWSESRGRSGTYHYVELNFAMPDGKWYVSRRQVPQDVHARAVEARMLRVKVDPQKPGDLAFVDFPFGPLRQYVVGGVVSLLGVGMSGRLIWNLTSGKD